MNDLRSLLDTAASAHDAPTATPTDDLTRGREALRRTWRRRGAVSVAGLAALAVVGVGAATALDGRASDGGRSTDDPGVAAAPSTVDDRVVVGPFSFDAVPEGWEVQGGRGDFVTMVPLSGAPDRFPEAFEGKLVILYEPNDPGPGRHETFEGRDYVVRGDSGHTMVVTATQAGEPQGRVIVQFPDGAFPVPDMIALLASVEVGPGAAETDEAGDDPAGIPLEELTEGQRRPGQAPGR
ncbi:hypothetical protein [Nocardioides sp. 1609]|uniref:hypothetical protein n=1 Tax=Nocardioides sp. 1609 TaxID=2508327 RepID=UPI00106F7A22|nr:hypothetical protein [Nocardioides sp. 1609]